MTREELVKAIEVMQACADGKEIEVEYAGSWKIICSPMWDWSHNNYRVRPQPKYKPYDNVSEIQRNKWVRLRAIKSKIMPILALDTETAYCVLVDKTWYPLDTAFAVFEYEDGTPFGKAVSE